MENEPLNFTEIVTPSDHFGLYIEIQDSYFSENEYEIKSDTNPTRRIFNEF